MLSANPDRVVLASTAETQPAGTAYFSSYEIFLLQFGYAFSDAVQATLTGLVDSETLSHIAELTLKANVYRSESLRVAALTAIDYLGSESDQVLFGRIGASATFCFVRGCHSHFSLSGMLIAHHQLHVVLPVGLAAGFVVRISSNVSLLLEYSGLMTAIEDLADLFGEQMPVWSVNYGCRFGGPTWALDVAFIRVMRAQRQARLTPSQQLGRLFGVPFLAFTYRFTVPGH
ncbi:MAG: hypothetical protein MJD61_08385 [Proteobacteria bacterium]|nr:hypothetical protein [Pseudomonadota bacterium]